MASAEYIPEFVTIYFPKHSFMAFLATYQNPQSCTLSLKESCRAQPMTANSQHLVQAGTVHSYHCDRSIAVVDAAWQLVPSDC